MEVGAPMRHIAVSKCPGLTTKQENHSIAENSSNSYSVWNGNGLSVFSGYYRHTRKSISSSLWLLSLYPKNYFSFWLPTPYARKSISPSLRQLSSYPKKYLSLSATAIIALKRVFTLLAPFIIGDFLAVNILSIRQNKEHFRFFLVSWSVQTIVLFCACLALCSWYNITEE